MNIGRIESFEEDIEYFLTHFGEFDDLEMQNYQELLNAIKSYKHKVFYEIIITFLKNKPELKKQIEETLEQIKEKKIKIEEEILRIEDEKVAEVEEGVNPKLQEMKHQHDLKILNEETKKLNEKLKRCEELIRNFGSPQKFIDVLVGKMVREKRDSYISYCVKRLQSQGIETGLELLKKDGKPNLENIELMILIASKPDIIEELKKFSRDKEKIEEKYSTSREQALLDDKTKELKGSEIILEDITHYMDLILKLYDNASDLVQIYDDGFSQMDEKSKIGLAFTRVFARERYQEYLKEKSENETEEQEYYDEIDKKGTIIDTYSDECNEKKGTRELIREMWEDAIGDLPQGTDAYITRVLDEIGDHDELHKILTYLNSAQDRFTAAEGLVEFSKRITRQYITDLYDEITKIKEKIKRKDEKKEAVIKKEQGMLSPIVSEAIKRGVIPEKTGDFERLVDDFETDGVVPAVSLYILYELLKDENITTIDGAKKIGIKINPSSLEEHLKKAEVSIQNETKKYNDQSDEIEI